MLELYIHTWRNKQASIRKPIFKKYFFVLVVDNWVILYFAVFLSHILHVLSLVITVNDAYLQATNHKPVLIL